MTQVYPFLQNKPLPATEFLIMSRLTLFFFIFLFFSSTLVPPVLAKSQEEWLKKAQALDANGFLDEAVEAWKKLTTADTDSKLAIYAHLKLGTTYLKLEQFQKSIDILKAITEAHPDNFDAHFNFANSLSAFRKFSEAIKSYKKTTVLRPNEGLGYVGLGLSLFGNHNSGKAIKVLLKANKLFKKKRNIPWHQDTRVMVAQIKHFAKFPPHFSNLWLTNNLKVVHDTYEKAVFDPKEYLSPISIQDKAPFPNNPSN